MTFLKAIYFGYLWTGVLNQDDIKQIFSDAQRRENESAGDLTSSRSAAAGADEIKADDWLPSLF